MSLLARQRSSIIPAICKMRLYGNGPKEHDGSIREAGGTFSKVESAREDQYFYNKQKKQLQDLKNHLNKEIAFHEEQIQRHVEAIKRHKEQMQDITEH